LSAGAQPAAAAEAEKIPPAIVARLGMDLAELQDLHQALMRVIPAARDTGDPESRDG
jgi:hypothetical protein